MTAVLYCAVNPAAIRLHFAFAYHANACRGAIKNIFFMLDANPVMLTIYDLFLRTFN